MGSFSRLSVDQMETLSEIVFGLSITFSAIQFALSPPTEAARTLSLIAEFAVSFLVLVWVWITYIRVVANLGTGQRPSLWLNVALLLLATVEPYLLYIVWLGTFQTPSQTPAQLLSDQVIAAAWSIDIGLMLVILATMTRSTLAGPSTTASAARRRAVRSYSDWFYAMGLIVALTSLPVFWIQVYKGTVGDPTTGTLAANLHLQLLLWVPVLTVFFVGALLLGRRLDQETAFVPGGNGPPSVGGSETHRTPSA